MVIGYDVAVGGDNYTRAGALAPALGNLWMAGRHLPFELLQLVTKKLT